MQQKIVWTDFRRQVRGFGIRIIVSEYALIAVALYAANKSFWWWPVSMAIIGRSQWILADNIGHWASHFTLFRKESWNKNLECVYFFPVFTTLAEWKQEHEYHHRYLGTPRDPQVATFERWGLSRGKNFWKCFLSVPYFDFVKNLNFLRVWRNRKLLFFWIGILSVVCVLNLWSLLAVWMLGYFIGKEYFMFASEVGEHWKAPAKEGKAWGSRNLVGVFFKVLKPHNDYLHKLHHNFPGVPPTSLNSFFKKLSENNISDSVEVHDLKDFLAEIQ